jgi:hypothetical protein
MGDALFFADEIKRMQPGIERVRAFGISHLPVGENQSVVRLNSLDPERGPGNQIV